MKSVRGSPEIISSVISSPIPRSPRGVWVRFSFFAIVPRKKLNKLKY